jgi:integrase
MNLRVRDFDLEKQIVTLNHPTKGSNPRQVKLSNKLTAMLSMLIRNKGLKDKLWNVSSKSIRRTFMSVRKNASIRLGNPNLDRIALKTFRHFKATMEYHKTKDILYVKELLGHKNIQNTLVYTHLVNWERDDFICRIATDVEKAKELIESGFEYVCDMDNAKLFRKRK